MDSSYGYSVRLLKEKQFRKVKFKAGQIVTAKRAASGKIYIMGYPSITLEDKDYEMFVNEVLFWRLLLQ